MEIFYSEDIGAEFITLDAEESGHCVKVLRHREGDAVSVMDGRGTLYECILTDADPKGARARIEGRKPSFGAHPYNLTMAVCPTKNADRFEWFAEKATEIGVDVIVPVIREHSERRTFKTDRVRRIVLSAAKQSLKALLPEVHEPVPVRDFISSAPQDALRLICYCDSSLPRERRTGISEALASAKATKICVLIGPEGDFSKEEVELALSCGWKPVQLGDSRLRTETAALVAVAAVYFRPV